MSHAATDMGELRVRARVVVRGRVQGVFFRQSASMEATRLALAGWIRNRPDGGVEAEFEGEPAAVEQVVEWCREGPSGARVDECEVSWPEPVGEEPPFRIRSGE